ncbi:MAG: hypothetical protein Faunusvirus33_1 [Faunusvirus sp.]|jgi:hypothetical protein|uniref:Uncharacterized protein n=1 Tax=Faunusvirus sp. TaxID=2487766 RepID=A0A3G4ZXK7_9VIRU|nr:MAG: hypothetical protein Faunusvirus33_1 [Faunusvirus sp.]
MTDITKQTDERKLAYLAVDIETSGSCYAKHMIVSIGVFAGLSDGTKILKQRISLKEVDDKKFWESRCLKQFWSQKCNQENLLVFTAEAIDVKKGMADFMKIVDDLESLYKLRILSDNSSFDIAYLNYYIQHFLGRNPLCYMKDQETYRSIVDTHSFLRGVTFADHGRNLSDEELIVKYGLAITAEHDHRPDNDAHHIFQVYTQMVTAISKRKTDKK